MTTITLNDFFNNIHNAIQEEIPYNQVWANGTGYLDRAVKEKLQPGTMVRSITDDNRKIIMIGTRFGTIVLFQRYEYGGNDTIVYNAPGRSLVKELLGTTSLDALRLEHITGYSQKYGKLSKNIGEIIEYIMEDLEEIKEHPYTEMDTEF